MDKITYIVGGRQTGKTHRLLLEYFKEPQHPFIVPTFPMMHNRAYAPIKQNYIHNARYLNIDKLRGIMKVYCDDFNYFPPYIQETLLSWRIDIVATMTPELIDMSKPLPPYWMAYPKAEIIKLPTDMSRVDFNVYDPLRVITDIQGYFVLKP